MVGVPMQRDERFGTRNVLTDEEFADRQQRAAQQSEQDNADFELENAASTPGGDVGGAVSPPPHWLERGQPQRQASLIVDPPNGRMPAFTAQAEARQAALRAARQGRGPADSYTDRSNYESLHHARLGRVDPARHLQQRHPDLSVAGLRDDRQRDDPRDSRRAARRPWARRLRHQDVAR
jgi:hypothetical protein